MKPILSLATLGSAFLILTLGASAQTPVQPARTGFVRSAALPKMIRVQVEFIELKHVMLTELMSDEKIKNDTVLRAKLAELIKKGEAKVMETQMVMARSGQKAVTESIEEYIYPTEYEPAEIPSEVTVNTDGEEKKVNLRDLATGPTPTAFETRNLGATLEVEPTLAPNNSIIDLRFAPEIVQHVRNEVWADWEGEHGRSDIQMPIIYSMRVSAGVVVEDGKYLMVAAVSPKGKDGYPDFDQKVMLFVKCDVLTPGS